MAITKTILKKTRGEAVIKFVGAGTSVVTLSELKLDDETLDTPKVDIHEVRWSGGATDTVGVVRNAANVLKLVSSGNWEFNGYNISEQNAADLSVTLSGETTVILSLRKVGGYVAPHRVYLTGGA